MKGKKSLIRNSIIILVVIILGVVGYKIYSSSQAPAGSLQTTAGAGTGTVANTTAATSAGAPGAIGQNFLSSLLSIQSITLDNTIFSSKAFTVLQDFNRPIPPDTNPGRPNPFAPLGQDSATAATEISTSSPSSITTTASTLNGTLITSDPTTTRWFEYGTTPALGTMTAPVSQALPGAFAAQVTGLQPNTVYYVEAAALISGVTVPGNVVQWRTAAAK